MVKQAGIVLITTILLLAVLSLFVLSQMQLVFLDYKALNQLTERHHSFFQLEKEAKKLAATFDLSLPRSCLSKTSDPNEVIDLLKKKQGCVSLHEKEQFYYLIENLGVFPCLQSKINHMVYSTQHLRISILSLNLHSILQLRIARLVKLEGCEHNGLILRQAGLQSWRYLSEI